MAQIPAATAATTDTTAATDDGATPDTDTAASVAARRRKAKSPTTGPAQPGAVPAATPGSGGVVLASRTLVSAHGAGGPARPVGGVWTGRPLVLETVPGAPSAVAGVIVDDPAYVVATCDAHESYVPPGCYTAVSKILWSAGNRVRKDLYDAVLAEHAARVAAGTATDPHPVALPPGIEAPPADTITAPAPPAPGVVA